MSEDPIGFYGRDMNLARYVANGPTDSTDPSGLADGFQWHWHHNLPRQHFTPAFFKRHGITDIDIDSPEYGWMIRQFNHVDVHRQGWNDTWENWIQNHERNGTVITKKMIDAQLNKMIDAFKLRKIGIPAPFRWLNASDARSVAQTIALRRSPRSPMNMRSAALGAAFFLLVYADARAAGNREALNEAYGTLDIFSASSFGDGDDLFRVRREHAEYVHRINSEFEVLFEIEKWRLVKEEDERREFVRMGLDAFAIQMTKPCVPRVYSTGYTSRSSLMPRSPRIGNSRIISD